MRNASTMSRCHVGRPSPTARGYLMVKTSRWRLWHMCPPQLFGPSRASHIPVNKVLDEVAHSDPALAPPPQEEDLRCRKELLQYIVEHEQPTAAEWVESAALQKVQMQTGRGVKRQHTTPSKVAMPVCPKIGRKVSSWSCSYIPV